MNRHGDQNEEISYATHRKENREKTENKRCCFRDWSKFSGKTTTCMLFQKSNISLVDDRLIKIIAADPSIALKGEFPRLIDEWQNIPNLWNLVRQEVDRNGEFGEYILTGSATPIDSKEIHHSGAGRITTVKMRPMSLFESLDSKGTVSLQKLFDDPNYTFFDENKDYSLRDTAYFICRGGWPQSIVKDRKSPWRLPRTITTVFSISNQEKMTT